MFNNNFSAIDISASGLAAERYRMEVIANNIANARATRSPDGGPFRRQEVVFTSVEQSLSASLAATGSLVAPGALGGVSIDGVVPDQSEFPLVYNPGHPDADDNGMVAMPNVRVPFEMVDMITASRAYEANIRSMQAYQRMAEQTLAILRGTV